jgi:hypothetical protein
MPAVASPGYVPGFRLVDSDHSYWIGRERILGVTEALTEIGLLDGVTYVDDYYLDRGRQVHDYTAAIDRHAKRKPVIDPDFLGYCGSWEVYKQLWRPQFLMIEHPLCDPLRRFGGRPDRVAVINRAGIPPHVGIPDLKTGRPEKWHRFQASLYELLVRAWLASGTALKALEAMQVIPYDVYVHADGSEPDVQAVRFEPTAPALIAAAQIKRAVFSTR